MSGCPKCGCEEVEIFDDIDSEIDWSNKIDLSTDSLYVDSIPLRRELNL